MKTLQQFGESLQNILDDSEMDTGDSYFCEICKSSRGNEKARDEQVLEVQSRILQVLGKDAESQFIQSRIEHGATCLGKPQFCSKFKQ